MSYLVRAIIEGIVKKYGKKMTGPRMTRLVNKEISVEVEGIELKIRIDEPCIMNIIAKK
jgi:ribosomal protein S6E (S10)